MLFHFLSCSDGERQCTPRSRSVWEDWCGAEASLCRSDRRALNLHNFHVFRKDTYLAHDCYCCRFPGIDVNIVDQKGLTALDIVKDMPSKKSKQIAALILGKDQMSTYRAPVGIILLFISHETAAIQSPVCSRSYDWKTPWYWPSPSTSASTSGEPKPTEKG